MEIEIKGIESFGEKVERANHHDTRHYKMGSNS